ncbi:MAG: MgtC/SapB family protein [Acidobacteria bacterium]|nr:MgtC/SapB family protein [Acidobacteriota bacterium]
MAEGTVAVRLLVAAALGGLVGIERELKEQPAGLRTHMLVSLGACLFTLVSAYGFSEFLARPSTTAVRADVTRVASQVVVGIGFLGGGAILRHGASVRGLTTAASLWVTAAVGLAVGAGFYTGAGVAAGLAVVALAVLKPIEGRLGRGRLPHEEPDPPDGGREG